MNKENEVNSTQDLIILDTNWKILNENKPSANYDIPISNMYQLYAYGDKYQKKENLSPKLILLYPKSENFNSTLSKFSYDEDLNLFAHPFD